VDKSLEVGKWLKVGESLEVFNEFTKKYAFIAIDKYSVVFTAKYIKIGCKIYSVEKWENFTDDEIKKMDKGALEWWNRWKEFILSTHKKLPEVY